MNPKTQLEAIATHLGWDINEAKEATYQECTWNRRVVSADDRFYCAVQRGKRPSVHDRDRTTFPATWEVAEEFPRWVVYRSTNRPQ
jgi:hypothetical protein